MVIASTSGCGGGLDKDVEAGIRERIVSKQAPAFLHGVRWHLMQQVYRDREYRPIWIRGARPRGQARDLIREICRAGEEGLSPADYDLSGLEKALEALDHEGRAADLAAIDLRLTALLLGLGTDLLSGRLDPRTVDDGWYLRARRSSVDSTLRAVLLEEDSPDMLEQLRPRQKEYRELVEALARQREILLEGGWPTVPPGAALKRGDRGPRVKALRDRLRASGDLEAGKNDDPVYDEEVAGAVARFQIRHGLAPDSGVGRATLSGLNVPVEVRIRQIELNLDRYRWLPAELEKRYLLVNIPDYRLYAYDDGKLAFEQRVIVGDEYQNATPVFADSMTYLVFRPEWNVPRSILVNEILPRLQDDDDYDLGAQSLELVDTAGDSVVRDPSSIDWDDVDTSDLHYRVRQKPGPTNSLGRLKFMFPNRFNIYLHDTPARALFERSRRTLSHGCVRVEDPIQLAGFVLDGQDGWNEGRVREAVDERSAEGNRAVSLKEPVPVYLLYLTAFVRDGRLHFRNDPYGKDRRAMTRLGKPVLEEPAICERLARLLGG
ncbi:MAG TPA: L,D-transpeptidase family protein [Gemmatimonadales bacterium]|nr:L,D-transpeptidase family protein [Gemmatimonadales bacterium]